MVGSLPTQISSTRSQTKRCSARALRAVIEVPAESKFAVLSNGDGSRMGAAVGSGSDKFQLMRTHGQLTDEAVALILSVDVDR